MKIVNQTRTKKIIYSANNAPTTLVSNAGNEVYEWEYEDKNGKIKKDKKNVQEEIQSYMSLVDYKQKIANGEEVEVNLNGNIEGFVKDYRDLQGDTVDIILLAERIAGLSESEIATLLQQGTPINSETITKLEDHQEVIKENDETQPPISNNTTKNNGGTV